MREQVDRLIGQVYSHMMSESPIKKRNAGLRRSSVLAWLHLSQISNRVTQDGLAQLRSYGLSTAQFDVLAHIGAAEGILQVDLADSLIVTQGNITQLLDKMESRGLIRRAREGRSNRLYLTPSGRQLYEEVVPPHQDFIASQFDSLTPDEQHDLLRLLSKLNRAQRRP